MLRESMREDAFATAYCAHICWAETQHPPTHSRRWPLLAAQYDEALALEDPHHTPLERYTFAQVASAVLQFASGLQALAGLRCDPRPPLPSPPARRVPAATPPSRESGGRSTAPSYVCT